MTSKGLNVEEIEKLLNFDWDDSDMDSENEDIDDGDFLENVIQETLHKVDQNDIDIELIEKVVEDGRELSSETETINEETAQVVEKINVDSLRLRSIRMNDCDTSWKNKIICGECKDPLAYFVDFFDDEIIHKICAETNIYAMQTNGLELKCEPYEIKRFIGVLLYLGAVKIPQMRMAWMENFRLTAITESFARNRFEKIKQCFHINDNSTQPQRGDNNYDKLHKVRPLLDKLKEKYNQIPQEEYHSIDEQIIAYKGHNSMKQYLPKKPHKWGFKMFTRAGASGIMYDFALYVGEGTCPSYGLGIFSDIVLFLSSKIPNNENFKLFFDNWFTSASLMIALKERGILAVGTLRANRIKNCELKSEKELKKSGRGSSDFKFEIARNLIICRWYDNKIVQLLSNYKGESPMSECKRWCRKEKKYVTIPRPGIVDCYNRHMGGVDLADMLIELYKINHRSKKWYMRIVYWCINSAVVNSWLLYRRDIANNTDEKKFMSLLNFQLAIAHELMHATNITIIPRKRGRPSLLSMRSPTPTSPAGSSSARSSSPSSAAASTSSSKRVYVPNPEKSKRYDQTGHWVEWGSKGRCRLCQTGWPRSRCSKCKVYLCCNPSKNCFVSFHT